MNSSHWITTQPDTRGEDCMWWIHHIDLPQKLTQWRKLRLKVNTKTEDCMWWIHHNWMTTKNDTMTKTKTEGEDKDWRLRLRHRLKVGRLYVMNSSHWITTQPDTRGEDCNVMNSSHWITTKTDTMTKTKTEGEDKDWRLYVMNSSHWFTTKTDTMTKTEFEDEDNDWRLRKRLRLKVGRLYVMNSSHWITTKTDTKSKTKTLFSCLFIFVFGLVLE